MRRNQRRLAVAGFPHISSPCWPGQQIWAGQEWKTALLAVWPSDMARLRSKHSTPQLRIKTIISDRMMRQQPTASTTEKLTWYSCISWKDMRAEKAPRFFCSQSPLLLDCDMQPGSTGIKTKNKTVGSLKYIKAPKKFRSRHWNLHSIVNIANQ